MMKLILPLALGMLSFAACGQPVEEAEPSDTAIEEDYVEDVYENDDEEAPVEESVITGIAQALAEYEALQEFCEYGSAQGLTITFLSELAPTEIGLWHSEAAIDEMGEAASAFLDANVESTCTDGNFATYKGRADKALETWNELKNGG